MKSVPRPPVVDIALAGALAAGATFESLTTSSFSHDAVHVVVALAICVPLAWRRSAPLAVHAWVWAVIAAASSPLDIFETAYVFIAGLLSTYSIAANAPVRRAAIGLAIVIVFIVVGFSLDPDRGGAGDYLFVGILYGGAWALGRALRERGLHAHALADRAERAEREREQRAAAAVAEEWTRIARELHDVIAHTVSVMVVQTGAVRSRIKRERPRDAELLAEVEAAGRDAIDELRRMLGVLRTGDERLSLTPQPGLDRLDPLVEQVRESGLPVEVAVEGERVPLPAGIDLAAYRILQESLTNALKHAGPARAAVRLRYGDRGLTIEVTDDGAGTSNGDGTGHGLVGMRERVALYGGTLQAGPLPGGGYAVSALLPLEEGR